MTKLRFNEFNHVNKINLLANNAKFCVHSYNVRKLVNSIVNKEIEADDQILESLRISVEECLLYFNSLKVITDFPKESIQHVNITDHAWIKSSKQTEI